jgi:hypothetical protein
MQHTAGDELRGKWEWLRHWYFFSFMFLSDNRPHTVNRSFDAAR